MDVGTAKPSEQARRRVRYWGLDVVDPDEAFSVAAFTALAREAVCGCRSQRLIVVGGTGLYLEAVLAAYDLPFAPTNEKLRQELGEKTIEELQVMLISLKPLIHNKTDYEDRARLIRAGADIVVPDFTQAAGILALFGVRA